MLLAALREEGSGSHASCSLELAHCGARSPACSPWGPHLPLWGGGSFHTVFFLGPRGRTRLSVVQRPPPAPLPVLSSGFRFPGLEEALRGSVGTALPAEGGGDCVTLWGCRTLSRPRLAATVRAPLAPTASLGFRSPWGRSRCQGPGWIILVTCQGLSGGRGAGGRGLSPSELLLLPAEDLRELAQLLAGSLRLLLQPLVVLAQAGHLRLQHHLVLLLLLEVRVQLF